MLCPVIFPYSLIGPCLSPLKPILVEGKWEKVVSRLGPLCLGGRSSYWTRHL